MIINWNFFQAYFISNIMYSSFSKIMLRLNKSDRKNDSARKSWTCLVDQSPVFIDILSHGTTSLHLNNINSN
jgi:hypothetical protein